jgi:hypothetical protein
VGVTILLSQLQQRTQKPGPPLLHYPGTESVDEQQLPNLGLRKYWFTLREPYPSLRVFDFYQRELTPRGWHAAWKVAPAWQRADQGEVEHDVFSAMWLSADNVYQLQLQMNSTVDVTRKGDQVVSEARRPGIEVYVTQQRSLGPWLLQDKPAQPPIDVKGK